IFRPRADEKVQIRRSRHSPACKTSGADADGYHYRDFATLTHEALVKLALWSNFPGKNATRHLQRAQTPEGTGFIVLNVADCRWLQRIRTDSRAAAKISKNTRTVRDFSTRDESAATELPIAWHQSVRFWSKPGCGLPAYRA